MVQNEIPNMNRFWIKHLPVIQNDFMVQEMAACLLSCLMLDWNTPTIDSELIGTSDQSPELPLALSSLKLRPFGLNSYISLQKPRQLNNGSFHWQFKLEMQMIDLFINH